MMAGLPSYKCSCRKGIWSDVLPERQTIPCERWTCRTLEIFLSWGALIERPLQYFCLFWKQKLWIYLCVGNHCSIQLLAHAPRVCSTYLFEELCCYKYVKDKLHVESELFLSIVAGERYLDNFSSIVSAGVLLICWSVNRRGVSKSLCLKSNRVVQEEQIWCMVQTSLLLDPKLFSNSYN